MRARLLAIRAAERRLEHLQDQGTIAHAAYDALMSEYAGLEEELEQNLRVFYSQYPDLTENEITTAHLEALRAQRSALFDLNRRGLISDDVYRELITEIDTQIHERTQTPAQSRAAESGPEVPTEEESGG